MIITNSFCGISLLHRWMPPTAGTIAIVSISDPNKPRPALPPCAISLAIQFFDVRNDLLPEPSILQGPSSHDAKIIRNFLQELSDRADGVHLITHCQEGRSRSAAVAKFVAEHYQVPAWSPIGENLSCYNKPLYWFLQDPQLV